MEERTMQATEQQRILSCLQTISEQNKKNQRRQKLQLIFTAVAACAMAGILLAVLVMGVKAISVLETTAAEVETVMDTAAEAMGTVQNLAEEMQQVDYENLSKSVTELATAGTKGISEALAKLETTMTEAEAALKKLEELDIEGLNEGIEQLNDITKRIQNALPSWMK